MPIGEPGWPELAACTASMQRVRMVLMASFSMAARSLATARPVFMDHLLRSNPARLGVDKVAGPALPLQGGGGEQGESHPATGGFTVAPRIPCPSVGSSGPWSRGQAYRNCWSLRGYGTCCAGRNG